MGNQSNPQNEAGIDPVHVSYDMNGSNHLQLLDRFHNNHRFHDGCRVDEDKLKKLILVLLSLHAHLVPKNRPPYNPVADILTYLT
jgi:hypothetical protein